MFLFPIKHIQELLCQTCRVHLLSLVSLQVNQPTICCYFYWGLLLEIFLVFSYLDLVQLRPPLKFNHSNNNALLPKDLILDLLHNLKLIAFTQASFIIIHLETWARILLHVAILRESVVYILNNDRAFFFVNKLLHALFNKIY